MNLTRCTKGHFYDSDKYPSCPHCKTVLLESTIPHSFTGPTTTSLLIDNPLQQYKSCKNTDEPFIFISYAHSDAERLKPYFETLEENNFRYWYDDGIPSGQDFYKVLAKHIKCCVQFVVFLSQNAQESENVRDEIHLAYKNRKNILPVFIENFELDDGLELSLTRKQHLCAFRYPAEDFKNRFYNELSKDAIKSIPSDEDFINGKNIKISSSLSDSYTNLRLINKSSMNEVFSAEAVGTGYPVIIKRTLLGNNQNKKFFYSCYQNEKRALETCMCPFIPQLIDCSEDEEYAYLIETKINGDTPYANASYSEKFVIDLGIKVAHILKYLYYYGITHCDIKPDNIIVNSFGDVFLIDFGSSIFTKDESNSPYSCGTRGFAAPEQFDQKTEIDFRTDIYALGRTMLSLLVGDKISSQNAFRNECENISITCALQNPSVKAQYIFEDLAYYDKNANPSLNKVINRMVSPRKEGRYYSLDELINDLKNCIR